MAEERFINSAYCIHSLILTRKQIDDTTLIIRLGNRELSLNFSTVLDRPSFYSYAVCFWKCSFDIKLLYVSDSPKGY